MSVYQNILETVGNTPIVKLNKVAKDSPHQFWGKVEYLNPGLSVKDRIALAIVEEGEQSGQLKPGGTIIEATSGNTGTALAMVAAVKGYKATFVMPDKISEEKRAVLRAYGARVIITPTAVEPDDPRSFYSVAKKLVEITPNSFYANQYHNPANPKQHYLTTGPEIWSQTDGQVDVIVGGAGTGGTISGAGRFLKEKKDTMKVVVADPVGSILHDLFYYKEVKDPPKPYKIEGIGEDMLPENVHMDVIDDFVQVDDRESFEMARQLSSQEGLCVGPSAGAAVAAAIKYGEKLSKPSNILIILPDNGRNYLSKAFDEAWMKDQGLADDPLSQRKLADLAEKLSEKEQLTIDASCTIEEATERMATQNSRTLAVISDGVIVGALEEKDISWQMLKGRISKKDPVVYLLQDNVVFMDLDSSLNQVEAVLSQGQFVATEFNSKPCLIKPIDLVWLMNQLQG